MINTRLTAQAGGSLAAITAHSPKGLRLLLHTALHPVRHPTAQDSRSPLLPLESPQTILYEKEWCVCVFVGVSKTSGKYAEGVYKMCGAVLEALNQDIVF